MATETIADILCEMAGITKKTEHSAETKVVVIKYALRLAEAHKREIDNQIAEMEEVVRNERI